MSQTSKSTTPTPPETDDRGIAQRSPHALEISGDRTTGSVRLSYLPGLDGLRALAVIAVLLYHAELTWIPGGFLGVEVFFVISGYLITALLLEERRRQGRINLVGFWMRRARRLLPALYLLLVVTLTFAVVFLPGEVAGLREDALAAFGYVTNWYLIVGEESYFEAVGRPSLLQHLWSLAVEEQFYVLWPLLLVAGTMLLRGRALPVVLAGAVGSALLMAILYRPDVDPSRIYYGTDTRAAGLLLGAALAFVWVPGRLGYRMGRIPPMLLDIVGLAALGGLVWFCLWLDQYQPFLFRGGFALVALVTAVVIMIAVHPRARLLGAGLLGRQPLRWVGLRSYGIYLWHWPVFMLTRPELDVTITGLPLLALRLATTVVLADLSYRFVETPIRNGAFGRAWKALREARGAQRWKLRAGWAGAVGTSTAFLAVLVVALIHAQPPAPPSYLSVESIHTTGSTPTPDTEDPDTTPEPETPPTPGIEDPDTTPETETPKTDISATATPEAGAVSSSTAPEPAAKVERAPVSAPADRVTAIGDSVMIGAAGELQRSIGNPAMYADVGMQAAGVIEILQKRRAAGDLGEIVVIHIGSNGTLNAEQFDEMMRVLKDVRRVAFVNVKVPRTWEQSNNEVLADGVRRYPNTVLVDWHAASVDRPELFVEDGIHLQVEGQQLYADLIAAHLNAP